MLKWLFGIPPKIGSKWTFAADYGNPYADHLVVVTRVSGKWVKYRWGWSTDDKYGSSTSVRIFRFIYREVKE